MSVDLGAVWTIVVHDIPELRKAVSAMLLELSEPGGL